MKEYHDTYKKVRFTSREGSTAGLIFRSSEIQNKTVPDLSRFFPYSESRFMRKVQVSPEFDTWAEAFDFVFEDVS